MRIKEIREVSVPLEGQVSNAVVNFSEHDVSLVAVVSDVVRNGRPVIGLGFNSIGRFAQAGILQHRIVPRILATPPEQLLSTDGFFDAAAVYRAAFQNEKPGGHGDRAGAIAAVELAIWDLNAKLRDEPAYQTIAGHYGRTPLAKMPVYAAGGYYREGDGLRALEDELKGYADLGFDSFKIKIGGAPIGADMLRIEAALAVCKSGAKLAVDANGRFDFQTAAAYGRAIAPLSLRWYEEIGDPLDFALNNRIAQNYALPIATGENLFSTQDVKNLLEFGGMRPGKDVFQMDAGLSYGVGEFMRMIALLESYGFDRTFSFPHGGHLINLHIACALGLGGCEAYPGVFQPFGGYSPECVIENGYIWPADHPGFGLEAKRELSGAIQRLTA